MGPTIVLDREGEAPAEPIALMRLGRSLALPIVFTSAGAPSSLSSENRLRGTTSKLSLPSVIRII